MALSLTYLCSSFTHHFQNTFLLTFPFYFDIHYSAINFWSSNYLHMNFFFIFSFSNFTFYFSLLVLLSLFFFLMLYLHMKTENKNNSGQWLWAKCMEVILCWSSNMYASNNLNISLLIIKMQNKCISFIGILTRC